MTKEVLTDVTGFENKYIQARFNTEKRREERFTKRALIIADILKEHERATSLHPPFNSRHEGYAILLEELEELWEIVKLNHVKNPDCRKDMKKEAIQVAAMSIRFIEDCCEENPRETW